MAAREQRRTHMCNDISHVNNSELSLLPLNSPVAHAPLVRLDKTCHATKCGGRWNICLNGISPSGTGINQRASCTILQHLFRKLASKKLHVQQDTCLFQTLEQKIIRI